MMKAIGVHVGSLVTMTNVSLPLGRFIKIRPCSVEFLDIHDPRAVLEHALRSFSAMTVGDRVAISYNDKVYEFDVREVKPAGLGGVSVVETDIQVDFEEPLGYQEHLKRIQGANTGSGGAKQTNQPTKPIAVPITASNAQPLRLPKGKIIFGSVPTASTTPSSTQSSFSANTKGTNSTAADKDNSSNFFTGTSNTLRGSQAK